MIKYKNSNLLSIATSPREHRNVDIEITSVVPPEIRLEVYKDALMVIQSKNRIINSMFYTKNKMGRVLHEGRSMGLCLLLPCVLWNLDTYMDKDPNGREWMFSRTWTAFPEIKECWDLEEQNIKEVTDLRNEKEYYEDYNCSVIPRDSLWYKYETGMTKIRVKCLKNAIKLLKKL